MSSSAIDMAQAVVMTREAVAVASKDASQNPTGKGAAWLALGGNRAEVQVSLSGVYIAVQPNPATGLDSKVFRGHEIRAALKYMGVK